MPDQGAQDKTEKPTPRRRQKAREKGQVAKSQELASVAVLIAGLGTMWLLGGYIYNQFTGLMTQILGHVAEFRVSQASVHNLATNLIYFMFQTAGPVLLMVSLAAILVNLAQVGFLFAPNRLKPSLDKINPLKGFKRFASMRILVELGKNLGKMGVIAAVSYITLAGEWDNLPKLGDMSIPAILLYILSVCLKLFWRAIMVMAVLAVLDWAYQKYDYEKNLKMSKQDIKDEYKQSEGDPLVKSRMRSIQREQARKRMMAQVPGADVVITNPTHLAVALAYKPEEMDAPTVLAKGANLVAQKIKEKARDAGVPIVEDKPLAQALFKSVEVGGSIPFELYEAVAQVLAHVYRTANRHRQVLDSMTGRRPQGEGV